MAPQSLPFMALYLRGHCTTNIIWRILVETIQEYSEGNFEHRTRIAANSVKAIFYVGQNLW